MGRVAGASQAAGLREARQPGCCFMSAGAQ